MATYECAFGGEVGTGRPAGTCSSCEGPLCPACLLKHDVGKGICKGHQYARLAGDAELLDGLALVSAPQHCAGHTAEAAVVFCVTCSGSVALAAAPEARLCSRCIPAHGGHELVPLADLAQAARLRLSSTLNGHSEAPTVTADSSGVASTLFSARATSQRLAAELVSVDGFEGAALLRVTEMQRALIAAADAHASRLRDVITAAARAKRAALGAQVQHAVDVVQRGDATVTLLVRAIGADGLSDADVLTHEAALVAKVQATCAELAGLEDEPSISARIAIEQPLQSRLAMPAVGSGAVASDVVSAAFGVLHT